MEWFYYLIVGITYLVYALTFLACLVAVWFVHRVICADIIEKRKAILASRKKWDK